MSQAVRLKYTLIIKSDTAENDSDKSFTVPSNEEWEVLLVRSDFTASASAGNRRVTVEIQDGSTNVLARIQSGVVITATNSQVDNFSPGLADQTSQVNGEVNTALPTLILAPGHVLRVYDIGAVDAAADDMTIYATIKRRFVTVGV